MATYSSFKKIDSDAIDNATIVAADIASDTVQATDIVDTSVPAAAFSGTVTSAKLASTIDLSSKTVTYRSISNADISASAAIAGAKLASGAAATNLGYTPINSAGDTLTGQLTVPAGSTSAPSIALSSDTTTGINITTNNVNIVAGGSTGINIDANGYITRPNYPAFAAVGTAGWLYAPSYGGTGEFESGNIMGWTTSHQYGGTNFNNNGRFTAPVTGHYQFTTWWYLLNDANTPPNYVHLFIRKNNSRAWTAGGRSPYNIYMHQNTNSYDDGASHSAVMNLSAGDFVSNGIVWHGNSSRHHAGHHVFTGFLIG
jgi:hypothetical protein